MEAGWQKQLRRYSAKRLLGCAQVLTLLILQLAPDQTPREELVDEHEQRQRQRQKRVQEQEQLVVPGATVLAEHLQEKPNTLPPCPALWPSFRYLVQWRSRVADSPVHTCRCVPN